MLVDAVDDMGGADLAGMVQAGGLYQLAQGFQGQLVEAEHALGLVGHDQGLLALRVLGRDAGGAVAGVAGLGLDAAQSYGPRNSTTPLDASECRRISLVEQLFALLVRGACIALQECLSRLDVARKHRADGTPLRLSFHACKIDALFERNACN